MWWLCFNVIIMCLESLNSFRVFSLSYISLIEYNNFWCHSEKVCICYTFCKGPLQIVLISFSRFIILGTHRHQESVYESQQRWQTAYADKQINSEHHKLNTKKSHKNGKNDEFLLAITCFFDGHHCCDAHADSWCLCV